MRIEESAVVDGELARLWSLLSSPEAWSLWPDSAFMFAVPEAPALRFFIGPTRRGVGAVLYEVCDEIAGSMIRLRSLPTGRQEFTLSVAAGRRGAAKASVRVKEPVPRLRLMGFEVKRRSDINGWLFAVRGVVEGRAQWPGAEMPAGRRLQCMARPRIDDAQDVSASVLIRADPATVWEAVHSPETARIVGSSGPIYSGYVPGTPRGEAGEMQYFVSRRPNGQLTGSVAVVTEISWQRSALTHDLGPFQSETRYLLTPESDSGPTRLEITHRWPAKLTNDAEAARSAIAQATQATVGDYQSLIETGSAGASASAEPGTL